MIPQEPPSYQSYLLRIWKEQNQEPEHARRFSLENPQSGERHGFSSLTALMTFLEEKNT